MFKTNFLSVLGLGDSLQRYDGNKLAVGVNDIWQYCPVKYVVCVDKIDRFSGKRLETMKSCKPLLFFSHLDDWRFKNGYIKMELAKHRGDLSEIDSKYIYSNNSTFAAVGVAYRLGYKDIRMFGVDFNNHKNIKDAIRDNAIKHFIELEKALRYKGVRLSVTKESALSEYLPCF